jgi:hypothetical protein
MNHAVNWEAISAIGQIIGAIAVVISLIYVASEVRRNTRTTHITAIRSMHDAFNHWIQQVAQYPDLADVYNRGIHDFESLEGTDLTRFFILMHGAFRNFERYITSKRRAIWKKACGVGGKRPCETSMHIREFRLGGVYARIGSVRSL